MLTEEEKQVYTYALERHLFKSERSELANKGGGILSNTWNSIAKGLVKRGLMVLIMDKYGCANYRVASPDEIIKWRKENEIPTCR